MEVERHGQEYSTAGLCLLNGVSNQRPLRRRGTEKQKVLWSLAVNGKRERIKSEEQPPKTGSRF